MYSCPLCNAGVDSFPWHQDKFRTYIRCPVCMLVFVPPEFHLSSEDEKAIYDQHNNQIDDPGYRRFLSRIYDPVCERVQPEAIGLDFGCGPGPALASMFEDAGYEIAIYDIHYANDPSVLKQQYDFVTATEVIEHLVNPREILEGLQNRLKPDGILGIMTKTVTNQSAFRTWHYIRDPTHICFFSEETFKWLEQNTALQLLFSVNDVWIFQKAT